MCEWRIVYIMVICLHYFINMIPNIDILILYIGQTLKAGESCHLCVKCVQYQNPNPSKLVLSQLPFSDFQVSHRIHMGLKLIFNLSPLFIRRCVVKLFENILLRVFNLTMCIGRLKQKKKHHSFI